MRRAYENKLGGNEINTFQRYVVVRQRLLRGWGDGSHASFSFHCLNIHAQGCRNSVLLINSAHLLLYRHRGTKK